MDPDTTGRTVCTPQFQPTTQSCISDEDSDAGNDFSAVSARGVCHSGDKCNGQGICEPTVNVGLVCRPAKGCCDVEEVCTQEYADEHGFHCPADVLEPVGTICRATCVGCGEDPEETCDGESPYCPVDTVFEQEMCVKAGKSTIVGSVSVAVTRTPLSNGETSYYTTIAASLTAPLAPGRDTVKFEFTASGEPGSNPGGYPFKQNTTGTLIDNQLLFSSDETCSAGSPSPWYLAIHFDMADGNTAWALPCDGDSTTYPSNFVSSPFLKPKKNGGFTQMGWGNYWKYSPCCKVLTDSGCPDNCTGGGAVPVGPPTGPEPVRFRGLRASF